MEIRELIEKQKELNALIGTHPENSELLAMALLSKCGKVAELLGSEWRWWNVPSKCSRDEMVGALTDVFKFLLVGMVQLENSPYYFALAHDRWGSDWNDNSLVEKLEAFTALADIAPDLGMEAIDDAFYSFLIVVAYAGISRDEIERAYLKLWKENMQRFAAK